MKTSLRLASTLLLSMALFSGAVADVATARAQTKRYVCPPCGQSCDTTAFDKPGVCPKCGMTLVDAEKVKAAAADQKKVAFLIFDGVEVIDFTGPYEMFGVYCDVYTVAATKDPVTTSMGLTVVPKYSFADAPQPDVLVVPGGVVKAASASVPTLEWVAEVTARGQHTMSVCNGAFILASAGLLDGLTATTTSGNIERLAKEFPKTKVVRDQRFVDNGKIVTTGGLSAGIDGALHVISKLLGKGAAQNVALIEEYDWKTSSAYLRATLADQEIPNINLDDVGKWDVVSTEGTTTRWEIALRGDSQLDPAELTDRIGKALEAGGKWTVVTGKGKNAPERIARYWKFTGRDGKPWGSTFELRSVPGESHHYTATFSVVRTG